MNSKELIIGKSKYILYSNGDCFSKQKNKLLTKHIKNNGYQFYHLWNGKKSIHKHVHRLVAESFIPNPDNKSDVNHINGNKEDNSITNLEWCTRLENMQHAKKTGLFDNFNELVKLRQKEWIGLKNSSREIIDVTEEKNKSGNYKVIVKCNCGNELKMYFNDFKKDKQKYCKKCRPKSSYS